MKSEITDWDEDLPADPEEEYQALVRALKRTQGFNVLFIRCSPAVGEQIINDVKQDITQKKIEVLRLEEPIDNLYDILEQLPNKKQIDVLFIKGLEKSFTKYINPGYGGQGDYYKLDTVPRILGHLNLQRERIRDNFNICFVFLLPFFGLKYFILRSPDFFDWRSGVFEFPTDSESVEKASLRILWEGDYEKYLTLTPEERSEKVIEIQELLEEDHQTPSYRASLFLELGNLLAAAKEYEAAITSYDQALKVKPDQHEAWYNRGYALDDLGRYEEAIASYDQVLKVKPDKHDAWYNRGYALGNLGRYEEAINSYDQALKVKPDKHKAWNNRGVALGNLGRYEEAIASYDKALKVKPDKHEAWYNRGNALENLGRYEKAIASYDKALKVKPDKHEAWYGRGYALGNLGRYEEAIASYDQALKVKPDDHAAWYNRGIALRNLGRYEEAIASYDQALKVKPDDANSLYNKACSYALQGNVEQAIKNLELAIDLSSEYSQMAKTDSDFDEIRKNKYFQALIQGES